MGRPNWESTQLNSIGKGPLNGPYKVWLMPCPTMLVVLSLPFTIIPFIYLLFKMRHLHRKIAITNQLIKIDSFTINYSRENEIILSC